MPPEKIYLEASLEMALIQLNYHISAIIRNARRRRWNYTVFVQVANKGRSSVVPKVYLCAVFKRPQRRHNGGCFINPLDIPYCHNLDAVTGASNKRPFCFEAASDWFVVSNNKALQGLCNHKSPLDSILLE